MIIDYTYGAVAQSQTYFGLGYYDTQSLEAAFVPPIVCTIFLEGSVDFDINLLGSRGLNIGLAGNRELGISLDGSICND